MRIANQMIQSQTAQSLSTTMDRLYNLQNQASSGKRITKASDDPVGTGQSLSLRGAISSTDQYMKNADEGKAQLNLIDDTLGDVTKSLQTVKNLGLQGATDTTDDAGRKSLAEQVQQQIDAITQDMNRTYLNRHIFSGSKSQDTPVTPGTTGSAAFQYNGDDGEKKVQVSDSAQIGVTVTAKQILNFDGSSDPSTPDTLTVLKNLKDALVSGDKDGIQKGLSQVDASTQNVISLRGRMGARSQQVDIYSDRLSQAKATMSDQLSQVENVDITDVLTQLQTEQNVYQATLIATSRVGQTSLADYLK